MNLYLRAFLIITISICGLVGCGDKKSTDSARQIQDLNQNDTSTVSAGESLEESNASEKKGDQNTVQNTMDSSKEFSQVMLSLKSEQLQCFLQKALNTEELLDSHLTKTSDNFYLIDKVTSTSGDKSTNAKIYFSTFKLADKGTPIVQTYVIEMKTIEGFWYETLEFKDFALRARKADIKAQLYSEVHPKQIIDLNFEGCESAKFPIDQTNQNSVMTDQIIQGQPTVSENKNLCSAYILGVPNWKILSASQLKCLQSKTEFKEILSALCEYNHNDLSTEFQLSEELRRAYVLEYTAVDSVLKNELSYAGDENKLQRALNDYERTGQKSFYEKLRLDVKNAIQTCVNQP